MKVSIIVPIYHGKKYISGLVEQAEACVQTVASEADIELVLINDAPDERLDENIVSNLVNVKVINTDVNRGIHGARVRGLENSDGEYVVFLDQDDCIASQYIKSQLATIGEADAVVCRLIHDNKQYYTNINLFENILDYEKMITQGNQIVSPGQVLLRRDAISDVWIRNVMKNNGADDWLLWLCMCAEGKKIVLNQEILFEHVVDGKNTSWDSDAMFHSEDEVYEILSREKVYNTDKLLALNTMIKEKQLSYIRSLELFRSMFMIYDRWMQLENYKEDLGVFLSKCGYHKIAIYGLGYIGKQLVGRLCKSKELSLYAIDRNAEYITSDFPVRRLEEFHEEVDVIIVTSLKSANEIIDNLKCRGFEKILTIETLLDMWEQG